MLLAAPPPLARPIQHAPSTLAFPSPTVLAQSSSPLCLPPPPPVPEAPKPWRIEVRASLPSLPPMLPAPPPTPGGARPPSQLGGPKLPPLVVEVAEIHGRACAPNVEIIRVPFPMEYRLKMEANVTCEYPVLSVHEIRGAGAHVEVCLQIDSRRSLEAPFQVTLDGVGKTVQAEGRVIIARPAPYVLGMQTICGGQVSADCPIHADLWQKKEYNAFFDPKMKEFWISQHRGVIEAGAKVFPFKVFFAPRDPRPIEALRLSE